KTYVGSAYRAATGNDAIEPDDQADWLAQRHRLLLFLVFAGIYVGLHVLFNWVQDPLFREFDWYYFGREKPSWFEYSYWFFLSLLPIAVWGAFLFVVLTRFRFLTHRRAAFVVILAGLMFFEADMRLFYLHKRHITIPDILGYFQQDAALDLGLREV